MKSNPFITGILDESEVENQPTSLEEIAKVFSATHLQSFYDPFLKEFEKYVPNYREKPGMR